ncbi:hypothetical protein FFI97_019495 [Variovorax sp. KBS0712]|uniref:hypothetical protein n=1 Tax=Variovorax sp. KBS0712 TaxID=2578111 RepID=UPI00111A51DE|nr:hypothetical protein [Variovorax sp. KBS0712]TSD56419.1 hypothetical protein FFI97_019495 [Variovorax sp. KBS0712]
MEPYTTSLTCNNSRLNSRQAPLVLIARSIRSSVGLVAGAVLGGCAWAQVQAPQYNLEDTWTYERIDSLGVRTAYTETVKKIGDQFIGVRIDPEGKARRYSLTFNPIDSQRNEIERVRFPLFVGNKWKTEHEWKNSIDAGQTSSNYKVEAEEEVVVPAGTFRAFKITNLGWIDNQTAPVGPLGGKTKAEYTYWYAPAAKRIVKYEGKHLKWAPPNYIETWSSKYELKSFKISGE